MFVILCDVCNMILIWKDAASYKKTKINVSIKCKIMRAAVNRISYDNVVRQWAQGDRNTG